MTLLVFFTIALLFIDDSTSALYYRALLFIDDSTSVRYYSFIVYW